VSLLLLTSTIHRTISRSDILCSFSFNSFFPLHEIENMATAASRRPKWRHHPPPPPTPRILHFPRRRPSFRRDLKSNNSNRLGTLIDRERRARPPTVLLDNNVGSESERRRERVGSPKGWALEEEKWKFQAEMLRAECNLLRMEKEIAVKKLQRTRVKMETTLRSALHTLVSVRLSTLLCF